MLDLLPDLCDVYAESLTVLPPWFRSYGGRAIFFGPVVTVRCPEDNSLVRDLVAKPGYGQVLVVDGAGSLRRALLGDQLAHKAVANGWAGIVVFGAVRDVGELAQLPLGIQALGACPVKTDKRGLGELGISVEIQGIRIHPGDWLYADLNGIAIAREELNLRCLPCMQAANPPNNTEPTL
ncbi:MAG: putative 4-hydroxy-4-methyl-2-oxoglutarate aldolase [Plesiomonas shigelloides]|uniref:putative 4-hydroxy-4-methyl-2-oxoglutarate aldolase n=1 Tax=Plesiomonas shigelloides TaxID=703 RepID=UPI000907AAB5|nr:putative 4-hydroxy-4-methyl-2-oxoglutarate aldolase [Plesiomonas shigelloides]AVQ88107.1 putative 4-hydroxy-4-methyl-2-oxoglutarate aldolase [Plesiomonas shigelloides]KAB7655521.1 putative 4-hydroxy-4-methyl-2-oxoglutarate aldolase [Plesiomonas shigelloides]QIY08603.1 putative 4-hydroxy-4-methyl-2-oxoglutarate aldolase [Plesiomonas shigelloides]QOH79387.1 putative 4-hydroxy-4-methyl-2-oxoglutarate aldolase [Plesiomonas shigelloides]SPZ45326.1 Putative regulator of ribonuclease activity [Ple